MKIFEWVKEIEDVYDNLIEKAKLENKNDLEAFKNQQEIAIKKKNENNQEFIKSALNVISEDITKGIKLFKDQVSDALENIKNDYKKSKKNLKEKIIKEFGFDFE